MATAARRAGGQNHAFSTSTAKNKQAQLAQAYQELGKELGSDELKVVGGYTLGRVIGEGTYGSVHIATHRVSGTRCAVKKIPKSHTAHLTREIHHHRRLHHVNIVHLHEVLATESHIWLVTELCSGGELFDYLVERGRMLEGEARRLFGELTVAVGWMHREGVVHRDLKLENVLLDGELRVKLGDLGFAREWQRGRLMDTFCGTTGYASPEMLAGRKYLGVETDVWSLGIILYILLCGGLPFDHDDEMAMKDLIMQGEYEEPEWLSEEARSLIRGMLQQDPAQRLTVEAILTHPWFKMTLYDNLHSVHAGGDSHSIPPSPNHQPADSFFSEPFNRHGSSFPHHHLTPHSAQPSPLTTHVPTIPAAPEASSESSGTSFEFHDSDQGRQDSGVTTPTTAEEDDGVADQTVKRLHSGEFSQTERAMELLHLNESQTTIRRSGYESPNSIVTPSAVKGKLAVKGSLEGQLEVDEEESSLGPMGPTSLHMIDEHSIHLPLALHSRTPSRTKRRSVSSTLSMERRHSYQNSSGQWQTYLPEDYLAKLNEDIPAPFSTPSEKHLLGQLSDLGVDTGQLVHSVTNDACDASAATWWILRAKQAERGETDQVVLARESAEARKRDRAAAYVREERRKMRDASREVSPVKEASKPLPIPLRSPSINVMDLGAPVSSSSLRPPTVSPENRNLAIPTTTPPPLNTSKSLPAIHKLAPPPKTPPKDSRVIDLSDTGSPARDKERPTKTRSPSVSMLQRATSAFKTTDTSASGEKKLQEEKEKRGNSPTKLTKLPPGSKGKMSKSETDPNLLYHSDTDPDPSPPKNTVEKPQADGAESQGKVKGSKRDSLWTTFRYLFNEDKRRRKRDLGSPHGSGHEVKVAPALVLSRGLGARTPHATRVVSSTASRRTSLDGRPVFTSRRSSSQNSRRSSFNSIHLPSDFAISDTFTTLNRRTSERSNGTLTPTSDREHVTSSSRPSSAHSRHHHSRRSSSSVQIKSPSLKSESSSMTRFTPNSPLHNYHRRATSGSASSRVRHIKVIHEITRSVSVGSSIKSAASSRASSVERDRERLGESGDEASSLRSNRRRSKEVSLAQHIHRTKSPLSETPGGSGSVKPLRDVFQSKEDSEWEDEDESAPRKTRFAGGLGQSSGVSMGSAHRKSSASAHPNMATEGGKRKKHNERERGRGRAGKTDEGGQSGEEGVSKSAQRRPNLPNAQGLGPTIEEEEEEE
ncbi:hypothetical protein P7C73_g2953, partial [Tremellales sp. Uapishka_1]